MTKVAGVFKRITPPGVGGIHVFALKAQDVTRFLKEHFRTSKSKTRELMFGHLVDGEDVIDEVIIHQEGGRLDISIHGGEAIEKRVAALLLQQGYEEGQVISPDPRRAQASDIFDEALACLELATAPEAVLFFLNALEGVLAQELSVLKELKANNDPALELRTKALLETAPYGLAMHDHPKVVLTGPVNAGKSTLFNALLEQDRAIVTSLAGTTRDMIEAPLDIQGFPFTLIDTAGIRETSNDIEEQGIARAQEAMRTAHIVIQIMPSQALLDQTPWLLESSPTPRLFVANKIDALTPDQRKTLATHYPHAIQLSATTKEGLPALIQEIFEASIFRTKLAPNAPALFTNRQVSQVLED